MNNLFAILTSPGFAREFDKADEGLPWLDETENVHPDDKPLPTEGGLFDEIQTPRDPLRQISDDEE